MTMDGTETQIAAWRAYVAEAPAVDGRDVDELEAHLRDQMAELDAAGLTSDEAFLVAVKRMGISTPCRGSSHASTAAACGSSSFCRVTISRRSRPAGGSRPSSSPCLPPW